MSVRIMAFQKVAIYPREKILTATWFGHGTGSTCQVKGASCLNELCPALSSPWL